MLDDLRSHETTLSAEEKSWVETSPLTVVVRALALAAVAVAIGVSVSHLLSNEAGFSATSLVATP